MKHSQKLNPDTAGRATPTLVRMPDVMRERLSTVAEGRGVSVGAVVRDAVDQYLDALDGDQRIAS